MKQEAQLRDDIQKEERYIAKLQLAQKKLDKLKHQQQEKLKRELKYKQQVKYLSQKKVNVIRLKKDNRFNQNNNNNKTKIKRVI